MSIIPIHGVYDGKTVRILPGEARPITNSEMPVVVIFSVEETEEQRLDRILVAKGFHLENLVDADGNPMSIAAKRLFATSTSSRDLVSDPSSLPSPEEVSREIDKLRESIGPIGISTAELISEGRRL